LWHLPVLALQLLKPASSTAVAMVTDSDMAIGSERGMLTLDMPMEDTAILHLVC